MVRSRVRGDHFVFCLGLLWLPLLAACSGVEKKKEGAYEPPVGELRELKSVGLAKVHSYGAVLLMTRAEGKDLKDLASAHGSKTVLNLCFPSEISWDERYVVEDLKAGYVSVAFRDEKSLTKEQLDKCRRIINDPARRPVLVHGFDGDRLGVLWLVCLQLDQGMDDVRALEDAVRVGLKRPGFARVGNIYVQGELEQRAKKEKP